MQMHRFHNIPDSLRERSIPLKDILQIMNLTKDDVVIDVGAGNGYYALAFAKICKKVYAVDQGYTDEAMNSLAEKASQSGLNNLQAIKRNVCDGLKIKDYTHAFFSNSFHDINCQDQLLNEIASQGAKLTIIEFKPNTPFGPPSFRRISEDKLVNLLSQYGYSVNDKKEFEFHYVLTSSHP
ncbi:MAG: class I SAM-dependent methyltransferase [Thermoprotei archaeon]